MFGEYFTFISFFGLVALLVLSFSVVFFLKKFIASVSRINDYRNVYTISEELEDLKRENPIEYHDFLNRLVNEISIISAPEDKITSDEFLNMVFAPFNIPVSQVDLEFSVFDNGLDSLDAATMGLMIEDEFGFTEIPYETFYNIVSLPIVDIVYCLQGAGCLI